MFHTDSDITPAKAIVSVEIRYYPFLRKSPLQSDFNGAARFRALQYVAIQPPRYQRVELSLKSSWIMCRRLIACATINIRTTCTGQRTQACNMCSTVAQRQQILDCITLVVPRPLYSVSKTVQNTAHYTKYYKYCPSRSACLSVHLSKYRLLRSGGFICLLSVSCSVYYRVPMPVHLVVTIFAGVEKDMEPLKRSRACVWSICRSNQAIDTNHL